MESLRGRLIIASPLLQDPNFDRTVVLITEHDEEGAMGLVLNRPSDQTVSDAVPDLTWAAPDEDDFVHIGGLETEAIKRRRGFELLELAIRRARIYAGHAGWGPGQLEDEIAEDAWIVETPRREELFSEDPESLWAAVLRRKGREFALLSTMPPDPSLN